MTIRGTPRAEFEELCAAGSPYLNMLRATIRRMTSLAAFERAG